MIIYNKLFEVTSVVYETRKITRRQRILAENERETREKINNKGFGDEDNELVAVTEEVTIKPLPEVPLVTKEE